MPFSLRLDSSEYCQLIRDENKVKRLDWCVANKDDSFDAVIFTDKCSIQMECHRRFACHRKGELPKTKLRPKHPIKVHVWASISRRGRTGISIFERRMNAPLFINVLKETLLPYLRDVFPDGHRFMQDNDPKHTSVAAQQFYVDSGINHWKTPPESPDLNPIENMWHELKEFLRREVKPHSKQELIDGIQQFWATVTVAKCKYINHLKKVIPE